MAAEFKSLRQADEKAGARSSSQRFSHSPTRLSKRLRRTCKEHHVCARHRGGELRLDLNGRGQSDVRQVELILPGLRKLVRVLKPTRNQGNRTTAASEMDCKRRAPSSSADHDKIHNPCLTMFSQLGTEIVPSRCIPSPSVTTKTRATRGSTRNSPLRPLPEKSGDLFACDRLFKRFASVDQLETATLHQNFSRH